MPGILDAVHQVLGKITGLHGAGQWGFLYDKNGFQIAPAGHDGSGSSTASNSEGLVGAPAGTYGFPPITLNRQVGSVGNAADATADVLKTYTLPASVLSRNNQSIKVRAMGTFAANGNNKSLTIAFGGTTFTLVSAVGINSANWILELTVTRSGLNTQIGIAQLEVNGASVAALPTGVTNGQVGVTNTGMTETETNTNVIVIKGTSGSSAANDVTCFDFKVDLEQF